MGYRLYKRPKILNHKNNLCINNKWVVFYNFYLLKKYYTHINMGVCSFIKAVTYLYKYICKGNDIVNISIMP